MTAKILAAFSDIRLALSDGDVTTITDPVTPDAFGSVRFDVSGLDPDTEYTYQLQLDGTLMGPVGRFRTLPSASAFSFTCAFSGDADTGSESRVFDAIVDADPGFFLYLGDRNYANTATNSPETFLATYDIVLRSARQARLHRELPTVYVWDDHDFGANNSNGTSASKSAVAAVYRSRVPHYSLPHATAIYHSFDVGRVRFIVTDQRSEASPNSDTDNSSKSMLGATQKAWFKNLLSNSAGRLIVWISPRTFGGVATAGADHWGGFTTERNEIGAHIAANCPGRVIVMHADAHALAIDDGTNHTYGGAVLPTFLCATLDQTVDVTEYGGATYSEGWFGTNGTFGTMAITDSGGATIGVEWTGYDSTGAVLLSHSFSVSV